MFRVPTNAPVDNVIMSRKKNHYAHAYADGDKKLFPVDLLAIFETLSQKFRIRTKKGLKYISRVYGETARRTTFYATQTS